MLRNREIEHVLFIVFYENTGSAHVYTLLGVLGVLFLLRAPLLLIATAAVRLLKRMVLFLQCFYLISIHIFYFKNKQ